MKKPRHTPGPWHSLPIMSMPGGLPWTPIIATTLIAKVYSTAYLDHEQSEANARIMAAGLRMLEVLQTIAACQAMNPSQPQPVWMGEVLEAIDLATKPTI